MMRVLISLAIVFGFPLLGMAQITIPNTFVPNTSASSAQVNANFSALGTNALNRAGGTITGNITVEAGFTIDGVDISAILGGGAISTGVATFTSTTVPQLNLNYDGSNGLDVSISSVGGVSFDASGSGAGFTFLDGVTISTLAVTTFTCTDCIGATHIASTAVSAAAYGGTTTIPTFTVDVDGRLTAAGTTATSSLTGIVETAITDGSVFPRLAGTEAITGVYTFQNGLNVTGSGNIGSTGTFQFASFSSPDIGRIFIGDGTGYRMHISTRASSTTADKFTFFDTGAFTATGAITGASLAATANATVGGTLTTTGMTSANGGIETTSIDATGAVTLGDGLFSGDDIVFDDNFGMNNGAGEGIRVGANTLDLTANGSTIRFTGGTFYLSGGGASNGRTSDRWTTIYLTLSPDVSSDRRLKNSITSIPLGMNFINALRPVSYKLNSSPEVIHYGFIAQEVEKTGFEAVSRGEFLGLRYEEFIAPIVKGLQEVDAENKRLRQRIANLEQVMLRRAD